MFKANQGRSAAFLTMKPCRALTAITIAALLGAQPIGLAAQEAATDPGNQTSSPDTQVETTGAD